MWTAAPLHQTLGAIEYNVANNFDDLQRPSGSEFMQSTHVDDDSLMKDSRGRRHGGRLSALISMPWCAPTARPGPSTLALICNPRRVSVARTQARFRDVPGRSDYFSSIKFQIAVGLRPPHATGTCCRGRLMSVYTSMRRRITVGGSSVVVTPDFQWPTTPASASVPYTRRASMSKDVHMLYSMKIQKWIFYLHFMFALWDLNVLFLSCNLCICILLWTLYLLGLSLNIFGN